MASSVNADSANVAALANDVKPNVGAPSPMQLYVALAKDSTNASNAGYATSSGSANRASSAGTSDTAKGLSITGFGNSNLTFYQTSASVQGSVSDWASYIMANHGSGASYYNQTLRLPFWGAPQIGRLENGANRGWQTLATESYVNSKVSSGGSMTPIYGSRMARSINTNYTASSNGYVVINGTYGGGDHWASPIARIYVNGFMVTQNSSFRHTAGFTIYVGAIAPVRKGDTYSGSISLPQGGWFTSSSASCYFIPAS